MLVAEIVAAQGLKGEVRLKSFTEDPNALLDYAPLTTETGRVLKILGLRSLKNIHAARIEGISDRNQAEALIGLKLYVDRSALPAPEEDEFYHADLIGLGAVDMSGAALGEVIAVHNFGAGDLLEVRLAAESRTVYVPFTQRVVPIIDIEARRVVIDPPEGLMDDPSKERPPREESE